MSAALGLTALALLGVALIYAAIVGLILAACWLHDQIFEVR